MLRKIFYKNRVVKVRILSGKKGENIVLIIWAF